MNNELEIIHDSRNIRKRQSKKYPSKKEKSLKLEFSLKRQLSKEKNKLNSLEKSENVKIIEKEISLLKNKSWYRSRHHNHCLMCNGPKYFFKKRTKINEKEILDLDFSIFDYHWDKHKKNKY